MTEPLAKRNGKQAWELEMHIDEVCDRFEAAWKEALVGRGDVPNIADFLGDSSDSERTVLRQELLALEKDYQAKRLKPNGFGRNDGVQIDSVETRAQASPLPEGQPAIQPRHPQQATKGSPDRADLDFLKPPEAPDELGRLGPYRILEVLGRGGMGMVLRAEHMRLGRQDALKVMLPKLASNPLARERFIAEARAAARIENDHVVRIYQADECDGVLFLAMPLLAGETLEARLQREKPLPLADLLCVGRETAEGLAAAHARGLIHRDIKPSNLWLETDPASGSFRRVIVLDFGLARVMDQAQRLTADGVLVGTVAYMAPEQADGKEVDHRIDLYSLGVVLYRAATGLQPFSRHSLAATIKAVSEHIPPDPISLNPDLPPPLCTLIGGLMSKHPTGRPESALEVAESIRTLESGREPFAHTESPTERSTRQSWKRLRPWTIGCSVSVTFAAMLCVSVGLGMNYLLFRQTSHQPEQLALGHLDVYVGTERKSVKLSLVSSGVEQNAWLPNALQPGEGIKLKGSFNRPTFWYLLWFDTGGVVKVVAQCERERENVEYPIGNQMVPVDPKDPEGTHLLLLVAGSVPPEEAISLLKAQLEDIGKPPTSNPRGPGREFTTAELPAAYLGRIDAKLPRGLQRIQDLFFTTVK